MVQQCAPNPFVVVQQHYVQEFLDVMNVIIPEGCLYVIIYRKPTQYYGPLFGFLFKPSSPTDTLSLHLHEHCDYYM